MKTQECGCTCAQDADEVRLLERLDAVIDEHRSRAGALIPVLQTAQTLFGYLPESALKRISIGMDMPYSQVAGVVGFYSFFSRAPRGEHLVRVCLGTACYVRGGKQVLESIRRHLGIDVGETTPDRRFTLEVARCFGACGLAPAMMIDEDIHQRVKPARVGEILAKYNKARDRKGSAKRSAKGAKK